MSVPVDESRSKETQKTGASPGVGEKAGGKTGYGIDEPRSIIQLCLAAVITIATGFIVSFYVVTTNEFLSALFLFGMPTVGFLILAIAVSLYWSSRLGKPREVERLMREIPWGGSERVLDVGCGRGLMMINAAKRLQDGYAVGVDLWKTRDLSGNDPASIWANARVEGVQDKVTAVKADARFLPFANNSVDAALSGMTLHLIGRRGDWDTALQELMRVVKEGGRVAVLDAGHGNEYADLMRRQGMADVHISRLRVRAFPPLHSVTARKPFTG
jgi:arsenite methyltransferase